MVISIMEMLTVLNAKINVIRVPKKQIFVCLVTELIEYLGHHLIMIASKYNFV